MSFLDSVIELSKLIGMFIVNTVTGLVQGIAMITTSLSFTQVLIGYMPALIGGAVAATAAVYILRFFCLK